MTNKAARCAASATLALGLSALAGAANAKDAISIGVIFPTQNQVRWASEKGSSYSRPRPMATKSSSSSRTRARRPRKIRSKT